MEKHVIVGSTNPVKIQSVRDGFSMIFPSVVSKIDSVVAASSVAEQPMSDKETFFGARNRAFDARKKMPAADYWIGIEGGICDEAGLMEAFAWIVVESTNGSSRARTATFMIPPAVASLVRKGVELGTADDIVFGRSNSKQRDGAVGLLTNGAISRTAYYSQAVALAFMPFAKSDLFSASSLINPSGN